MPATVLTPLERRVVGNLRIPRNARDLGNHLVSSAALPDYSLSGEDLTRLLEELAEDGYVVKLKEDEPHKLAEASQKKKAIRTMPDEMAEIYSRRLAVPARAWRARGDQWIQADGAHQRIREALRELNHKPPLTTSQLIESIRASRERVHMGDPSDPEVGSKLLPEEFANWLDQVLAEHERVWGSGELEIVKRNLPQGGDQEYSDFYENVLLDAENQKVATSNTDPFYIALAETTIPTDATTGSTIDEPEYTGYARKSVAASAMNSAASRSAANNAAITFADCTSGTDTVTAIAQAVAATIGNLRKYTDVTDVTISTTQMPANIASGQYVTTLD